MSWKKNQFFILFFILKFLMPANAFAQCGIGRWKVKTISDADTLKINFDSVAFTSIHEQLLMPKEKHFKNKRSASETTVYSITCRLVAFRKTIDTDIHLIVQDASTCETMVAEI